MNSADFNFLKNSLPSYGDLLIFEKGLVFFGNRNFFVSEWPPLSDIAFFMKQVHGSKICDTKILKPSCDGIYSPQPFQPLFIRTADCMPVFVADSNFSKVLALHIGWRGLMMNILTKGVEKTNFGSRHLHLWVGPHIGPKDFHLTYENSKRLLQGHSLTIVQGLSLNIIAPSQDVIGQYQVNLSALLKVEAQKIGLNATFISPKNTFESLSHHSHRRYPGNTNRLQSFIMKIQ